MDRDFNLTSGALEFGPFHLDLASTELLRDGRPVKLQPQPVRVLALLAGSAGRLVTRDEIYSQVWRGETFVDFEQGLNYCIRQIRAALDDDARTPVYIETLQRRGYRFVAPVQRLGAPSPVRKILLAVRPFENLGGGPDEDYVSDGLTDEMITELGRLNPERLGVIARTSVMRYRAASTTVADMGRDLGVSYVLEGSVRRSGSRARVTAQLIKVADETQVWADSYDRAIDDMLTLERDVARAIAREIDVTLTPNAAKRLAGVTAVNPLADEAYLKGRYFWNKRTAESFEKGIDFFHEAIAHDPTYAAAYDGLSDSFVMLACRGVLPARDTFQKARDAARRALAIDATLGEAHATLAHVRLHDWDWVGLDRDFRRALELNPGYGIAHYWYAEYLMAMGRADDAIAMVRAAHRMDPLSAVLGSSLGMILYLARRYDESIVALRNALEINPDHFLIHFRLALSSAMVGNTNEAIEEMRTAVALSGRSTESLTGLAQTYAAAGRQSEMQAIVAEVTGPAERRYVSPYNLSRVFASARDVPAAFAWLERAYDERNPDLIELKAEPVFDAVRPDPRFGDLIRRVGWTATAG
jgi:TolB-like protein